MGAFAAGKTSLVSRYVKSLFSEHYLTTVGVKVDKKQVTINGTEVGLIVWDLHGEDELQRLRTSYLRGSSAYVLVIDRTRPSTLQRAVDLHATARQALGKTPFIVALNKKDLEREREVSMDEVVRLFPGARVVETSAKDGTGVNELFQEVAEQALS